MATNDIFDYNEDHEEVVEPDKSIIRNSFNDSQRVTLIPPATVTLGIERQAHSFATHNDEHNQAAVGNRQARKMSKKKEKSADFEYLHNLHNPSSPQKEDRHPQKRMKQPPKSQQMGPNSMSGQNAYENYQMSELRMSTGTRPPILQYTNTQSQTVKQEGGVHGGGGIGIDKKSFPYDEEEEEENNIDNMGK